MLHRLPNGTWIRLTDVTAITPMNKLYADDRIQVIVAYNGTASQLPFETFVSAKDYADDLAKLVNAAQPESIIAKAEGTIP